MLLQLGAWTWMVASYAQESSIEQAFKETFSGDRPCEMCKLITAVDEAQEETAVNIAESSKLTLLFELAKPIQIHVPKQDVCNVRYAIRHPKDALRSVPTPPPRWV